MTQTPDTAPGSYYVSVKRGNDTRLLAGPYPEHAAALADVESVTRIACELDPKVWFDSFGTVRMAADYKEPGILNRLGKFPANVEQSK